MESHLGSRQRTGTNCEDFLRAHLVKRKFGLEYLGVRVSLPPWRMVEEEFYTQAQPPTANLGAGRSASTRAEFRRLTRERVRAWCLGTMSFAR